MSLDGKANMKSIIIILNLINVKYNNNHKIIKKYFLLVKILTKMFFQTK